MTDREELVEKMARAIEDVFGNWGEATEAAKQVLYIVGSEMRGGKIRSFYNISNDNFDVTLSFERGEDANKFVKIFSQLKEIAKDEETK